MENTSSPNEINPALEAAVDAPVPAPTPMAGDGYKAELERAFLLCTEKLNPGRVKMLSEMFDRFQKDPFQVVTQVFDNYTRMLNDPYLQYTTKPQDVAGQALMTGIMLAAGMAHSDKFREKIIKYAQDHLPDTNKILTFEEVRRKKALGVSKGVF